MKNAFPFPCVTHDIDWNSVPRYMFGCLVLNLLKIRDTNAVLHSFITVDVISLKLSRKIWICDNSKCSLGQRSTNFLRRLHLACNAFCFSKLYNRFAHVKRYIQSKRLLLTAINCTPYTTNSFVRGKPAAEMTPSPWQPPNSRCIL